MGKYEDETGEADRFLSSVFCGQYGPLKLESLPWRKMTHPGGWSIWETPISQRRAIKLV